MLDKWKEGHIIYNNDAIAILEIYNLDLTKL